MTEEEQAKLAMEASMKEHKQKDIDNMSEEEMLKRALEESALMEKNEKLKDEEMLLQAMKESHEAEQDRLKKEKDDRIKNIRK